MPTDDEIGAIVTAFNGMRQRLSAELDRRAQIEAELRLHQEALEHKVTAKTLALTSHTRQLELQSAQKMNTMINSLLQLAALRSAAEQAKLLFQESSRLAPERPDSHGLGLSIVQRICHKLGGRCGYEALASGGSKFWFELPDQAIDGSAASPAGWAGSQRRSGQVDGCQCLLNRLL